MAKRRATSPVDTEPREQPGSVRGRRVRKDDTRLVHDPVTVHAPNAGRLTLNPDEGTNEVERLLALAKRQYRSVITSEAALRTMMREDRYFRIGQIGDTYYQWPDGVAEARRLAKRPVLQVNHMGLFVDMARSEADEANFRIKVNAVDSISDPKTANVLAGLIRNTETNSFAEDAYEAAGDGQCEQGRGYAWVRTEWAGEKSWDVRAKIDRILDPLRVKVDAGAQEKDQQDAEFSFYDTELDNDTWDSRYGQNGKRARPSPDIGTWGDEESRKDWFPSAGYISVKHWYCAEYVEDTLYQMTEGAGAFRDEIEEEVKRLADTRFKGDGDKLTAFIDNKKRFRAAVEKYIDKYTTRSRPVYRRVIKERVIDAEHVLEESEWPTKWQPFVACVGSETEIEGRRILAGIVRNSKDSQKIYNVHVTSQSELVNDAPKVPWVGPRGVFGQPGTTQNNAWRTAHTTRHAYLEYEVVDIDGKTDPRPQRNQQGADIGAVTMAIQQAAADMKETARWHDASLGEKSAQESGTAINARQRQDERANSHYTRNRRRFIAAVGRQLIALYRATMTTAQVARIIGHDEKQKSVMIYNGPEHDPRKDPNFQLPEGVEGIFDIGAGEFDIEVSAAPSAGSRRSEDLALVGDLMKVMPPQMMAGMADLTLALLDSPVGQQMADRARKMLGHDDEEQQVPPAVRQQMQLMQAKGQELAQELQEAQSIIRDKRLEIASKESIEAGKRFIDILKLMVEEDNADRRLLLQSQLDHIKTYVSSAEARLQAAEDAAAAASAPGGGEGGPAPLPSAPPTPPAAPPGPLPMGGA